MIYLKEKVVKPLKLNKLIFNLVDASSSNTITLSKIIYKTLKKNNHKKSRSKKPAYKLNSISNLFK